MDRRIGRYMLAALCALIYLLALPALAESVPEETPVILLDGQPVTKAVLNVSLGNQLQLTSNMPVVWKSSKPYRGEVDQSGLVTSKTTGTITITATAENGKKAACELKMTRLVTGISITGPSELAAGKSGTLKAAAIPANAANRSVSWSSSNPEIVSVNSSGRITAKKVEGIQSAVITATAKDGSGVFAQYIVTVRPAAANVSILANGQPVKELFMDITPGNPTVQLSAVVLPADAGQAVTWKSSSGRVKVSADGLITGMSVGSATITATAADGTGRKATVKVSVVRMATGIEMTGASNLLAGGRTTIKASVQPKNASNRSLIWESSDPTVATVNRYGQVTAKQVNSVRTVTITARAADGSGVFAQHVITVTPKISSMQITLDGQPAPKKLTMDLANPVIDLGTLIQPADACQEVKWTCSSASRAKVDENGVVTGLKTGTVTITATAQDGSRKRANVSISIVRMVKGIAISGDTGIAGGRTGKLVATFEPSNATNKKVVWESSNPDILTVNKYGSLRAAKVSSRQTVTVYAKAQDGSGVVGSIDVTITPRASAVTVFREGVAVQNAGIDLGGNRVMQLTAQVGPEDALQAVKWSTSNKSRATVDQNGLVTGLRAGTVTITATAADGTGVRAQVKVKIGMMVRQITVTGAAQLSKGGSITLKANVQPSNATDKDVQWSSSNEAVAKVNKYGKVTASAVDAPTQVTIYATAKDGGGAIGEHVITVVPQAKGVSIDRADADMPDALILNANGATARLTATVYPVEAQQNVKWSSSNSRIVSVDENGNVISRSKGRAKITAKATDGSGVQAVLWVGVTDAAEHPYYVEVDHANQVVRVYERAADGSYSKLIKRMICSTGKRMTPSLHYGLHAIDGGRMYWMRSVVDSFALYATRIEESILFHSVPYPTKSESNLDASAYGMLGQRASLGCIRLLASDSKWIHDNLSAGSFVNFVEGVRDPGEYGTVSAPPLTSGKWDPTNPNPANPDFDPTYSSDVQ